MTEMTAGGLYMNKLCRFISISLAMMMLHGMTAVASAAERDVSPSGLCVEHSPDGVTTVVAFENGSEFIAQGAIDLTATEQNPIIDTIESFDVVYEDEVILTVEPKDIASTGTTTPASNGYYMVDFILPNSEKECFISGMTARKAETIQNEIITAWAESTQFTLEDVDFIDAEKMGDNSGDSQLCWAAAVSNMLHFTGWGELVGFHSEDDLFDIFPRYFIDDGYYEDDGIRWFFDGTNSKVSSTKNRIKDYPNSGRYLPDYDVSSLSAQYSLTANNFVNSMKKLDRDLKAGHAVGLSVKTGTTNAHAITCWGIVTDNSYTDDDASHYVSFIVADSDDDMAYDKDDRRSAPNKLHMAPIERFEDNEGMYYNQRTTVYRSYCGALYDCTTLAPYSADIPKETDPKATKNRTNTIDLFVNNASVANSAQQSDFASDTVGKGNVTVFFQVIDYSDIDYIDYSDVRVTLYKGGEKIKEVKKNCYIKGTAYYESRQNIEIGELDVGSYTAEITVNPDKALSEAYYMNNTFRYDFTVIQPEYDASQMSLSVELKNSPASPRQNGTVNYDGIPEELLRAAERVNLQVAQYSEGESESYSTVYEDKYSELNPLLPVEIRCNKTGYNEKFRLMLLCRNVVYTVYSPEYHVSYINISVDPTDNDTQRKSPIAYGGTQLNAGEKFAFTMENRSWYWDSDITGTYTLVSSGSGDDMIRLSDPVPFSLKKGEKSPEIVITSWKEPLYKTGNLNLLIEGESDGTAFQSDMYLSEIRVVEQKSTVVTNEADTTDAYDGQVSLREAITYAKELGRSDITISNGIKELKLDSGLKIDFAVNINVEKGRKVTVSTEKSVVFRVVRGGGLNLSGLFFFAQNQSETEGGAIVCEGGKVTASDCRFNYTKAFHKGALLYMDGGSALMKNCSAIGGDAADGTIAYITGGAKVEILNCLFDSMATSDALIHNMNGSLNLINSIIVSCYVFDGSKTAVKSEQGAHANVVNCMLLENRGTYDADGGVKLYSTAYNKIGEQAIADTFSKAYQTENLFKMSGYNNPVIKNNDNSLYLLPMLKRAATEGCLVTEKDGVLYIGKDKESMSSINVSTAFTAEELAVDMVGYQRRTIYGSYSVYEGSILGDVDSDGAATVIDATLIQRYDVEMTTFSDALLNVADVDRDGEVTVIDATWIRRYEAQMTAPEGIGKPIDQI